MIKFEIKHGRTVGQIFRKGNHLFKVTRVLGPFYQMVPYSYGIFAEKKKPWLTCEDLIRRGIVSR